MRRNIFILMLVIFTVTLMLFVGRKAAQNRAASGQPLTGRSLQGAAAPDFELKSIDGKIVNAISGLVSHSEIEENVKKALAGPPAVASAADKR